MENTTINVKDTKDETWYSKLLGNISKATNDLQLPGEMKEPFREFVMGVARDQYVAGNKNGIKWLRMQISKEGFQGAGA